MHETSVSPGGLEHGNSDSLDSWQCANPATLNVALNCSRRPCRRWGLCNAYVFRPALLDDDVSDLLLARFKGEDAMSLLVDRALGASVADAPR